MEKELVKIAISSPAYPQGYYTQIKDQMKPGDAIFGEASPAKHDNGPAEKETPIPAKPANRRKVKK